EPADMREDEEYQGRVQDTQSSQNNCSLRITNLRESDAQTYRFRFHTDQSKYTGKPGVSLSVTDLEVKVSSWSKTLSCITTCALSNNPTYIWYKNGQSVSYKYINYLYLYDGDDNAGSYSCAVKGHEYRRSPAVCVLDKNCWSVTYSSQKICSLIGSSVDIHSYYTFPNNHDVRESFWFIKQKTGGKAVDMTEDDEYQGRVQYTHSSKNNCSLGITNLRESDAQTYTFRFHTNYGDYSGEPGVSLSVTGLKITVFHWYGRTKKLNCVTSCTLSNNPIYIWYKNGQPVTNEYRNELDLYDNTDEDNYSCS
ncbi:sialoadhesin isoform X2, partial [Silurus asotus]